MMIVDHSEPISPNTFSQLEVLRHDSHPLCMDSTQVSILKQRNQVGLSCLLESQHCLTLESDLLFELSRNLTDKSLEGKLPDQQVSLNKLRK